jgi:hypothetical protein
LSLPCFPIIGAVSASWSIIYANLPPFHINAIIHDVHLCRAKYYPTCNKASINTARLHHISDHMMVNLDASFWVLFNLFLVVILPLSCYGGYQLGAKVGQRWRRWAEEKTQFPPAATSPGPVQTQQFAVRHVSRRASDRESVHSQTMRDPHRIRPTRRDTPYPYPRHRSMSLPELVSVPNSLHLSGESVDTLPRYVHSPGRMV